MWTRYTALKLVEDYRRHPELWDVGTVAYKNRVLKKASLNELAKKYNAPANILELRIKNLRSVFRREHKKALLLREQGDVEYVPKWFAYKAMLFLLNISNEPRMRLPEPEASSDPASGTPAAIQQPKRHGPRFNLFKVVRSGTAPTTAGAGTLTPSRARLAFLTAGGVSAAKEPVLPDRTARDGCGHDGVQRRSETTDSSSEVAHELLKCFRHLVQPRDKCATYGEHVANLLRELSPHSQAVAIHLMGKILYNAAMSKYEPSVGLSRETASVSPVPSVSSNREMQFDDDVTEFNSSGAASYCLVKEETIE